MVPDGTGCRKGSNEGIMSGASNPLPRPEAQAQMHYRSLVVYALLWQGLAACGRSEPETTPPMQTVNETPETLVEDQQGVGAATEIVGEWELRSHPPSRMPGLQLTVTVDSASGTRYFGRLTNYFAGDVGMDPRDYESFADSIRPGGYVVFAMPATDPEMLGIVMEGTVEADTVRLVEFLLGPDTISSGTRRWVLARRR